MLSIPIDDPRAVALMAAIHAGDVDALDDLLRRTPELASGRVVDARGVGRTLLHIVADWPGHFPNAARSVARIVAAGADPNAPLRTADLHAPRETPLHWAASSDDVAVLDALLDAGADMEAVGGAFTGGAAMSNAVIFAQWRAARRLLERGAMTTIWQAAALGLLDRVQQHVAALLPPAPRELTNAFWHACRGGQRAVAEYLLERGADAHWTGHDRKTPLDAARASGNAELVEWLRARVNADAHRWWRDFYARLGGEPWRGALLVRIDGELVPVPSDEEIMILRHPRTPHELDLAAPLSIEWRPREIW